MDVYFIGSPTNANADTTSPGTWRGRFFGTEAFSPNMKPHFLEQIPFLSEYQVVQDPCCSRSACMIEVEDLQAFPHLLDRDLFLGLEQDHLLGSRPDGKEVV